MNDDLRTHIEQLRERLTESIDSPKTRGIDGLIGAVLLIQCEQLQRLAHTLHRIDGSLEALLKEFRNARPGSPNEFRLHSVLPPGGRDGRD